MKKVVIGIISKIDTDGIKKWLLVSASKDFGKFNGYYYPPGGHIEKGESESIALSREIKEELNLDAKPLKRIAISPGDVPDQETYWWLCDVSGKIKRDSELTDAQYFTKEQIDSSIKIWPATRKIFEKYIFERSDK